MPTKSTEKDKKEESTITTPDPAVTTPDPAVTTPDPAATIPDPAVTTPDPAVTTPDPAVTTPDPAVTTPDPAATIPDPAVTTPDPAVTTPDPAVTTPDPAATIPDPAITTPDPAVTTPDPAVTTPDSTEPTLSEELQRKIIKIKSKQVRMAVILKDSKEGVKTALREAIMKAMTDQDFEDNSDYQKANEENRANGAPDYSFEEWVKTLSKEQQLDLLAEYTIDAEREQGYNEWEKPIGDAQKAKDVTKKAIAVQAKEVIESYKQLMVEHEELITDIKEKIKNKRDEIDKIDEKINKKNDQITANNETLKAAKNAAPTEAQINEVNAANATLQKDIIELKKERDKAKSELEELEGKLTTMEEQKDVYKAAIDEQISELEESLKEEGIYVGSYEGLGGSSEQQAQNEANEQTTGNGSGGVEIDERKPKDIAKAMMADFRNLAPEEVKQLIERTGYEDLLNMAREIGPINRLSLRSSMQNRLDDLKKGLDAEIKDDNGNDITIHFSKKELKNLSDLGEDRLKDVISIMNYYTENYESMSVAERKKAEETMEYLKISTLLTETNRGKIGRFMGRFTQKGTRISEIGNSLRRFATERGKREDKKSERTRDIRTRLGIKTPMASTPRTRHVDRSGYKPIQMDRED